MSQPILHAQDVLYNHYQAQGVDALQDAPKSGKPFKVSVAYHQLLLSSGRQRPSSLGQEFSLWTLERLANYLAESTGVGLRRMVCVFT